VARREEHEAATPTTDFRRVPGLLSETLISWVKALPAVEVHSTLPIVEERNTVAIHFRFIG
jgi:hypothetical protein